MRSWARALALYLATGSIAPALLSGQERPVGREALEALVTPPLEFAPPEPVEHVLGGGVRVLHLRDSTLPLVSVHARFRGGYGRFPRDYYAAGTALPALLRTGGTRSLSPDSVDVLLESYAVQTSFSGGGGSVASSFESLSRDLDVALELWAEMLRAPRFDSARVEVWRGQELEAVRRRGDDPGRLAFGEFNRLMYGDHPIGWEMSPADLTPERFSAKTLAWVHERVLCPDNLILGVTGDVSWPRAEAALDRMLEGWPPCPEPVPEAPLPDVRRQPGVFLIPKDLDQSTIVMAHAVGVRQEDDEAYFAAQLGNTILGAGGLSSRLSERVRTEAGLAYGVSSLWTTPRRHDGLVGAITRTRADATVAATRLVLETFAGMTRAPPLRNEVEARVEEAVNGFVFSFTDASQIVARRMFYLAEGLPDDWLTRYLDGLRSVTPEGIHQTFRDHVRPEAMTILVVGDPDRFDEPLESLGPVTILDPSRGRQ